MQMATTGSGTPRRYVVNPRLFVTWLFCVSSFMIFAGLSSAYILALGDATTWKTIPLPVFMKVSTGLILASSFTMHWAWRSAKKNNLGQLYMALVITFALGVGFLISQYYAFQYLVQRGFFLVGTNKSPAYLYVLSGLHAVHIVSGLIFVAYVFVRAIMYKVHSKEMLSITQLATFWHFIDALWLYLFVFFTVSS